jgi:hypothetical protein
MQFGTRSIRRVLADLTSKLENLPATHVDRPKLARMVLGLRVELATREPRSQPAVADKNSPTGEYAGEDL